MTTAREIMSSPVSTLSHRESLYDAATELFRRGVSGAPVCNDDGGVVGVVSQGDLGEAWLLGDARGRTCIADVMSPDVATALPDEDVKDVAARMVFDGIHRVVVVDTEGTAIGLISPLDILRAVVAAGPFETRAPPREASRFASWPIESVEERQAK